MKKRKTTQPKPPQPGKPKQVLRQKKAGGDSDSKKLAALKRHVSLYAMGDTAAKVMILAHYVNWSRLFERRLNDRFDHDPAIQKKLKVDFKNNLMAYVRWVNAPGNQVPAHSDARLESSGPRELTKPVGFRATGATAAKAIILAYYRSYSHLLHDFIQEQFERDGVIQATLQKKHKNNLYAYLGSLYVKN